MSISKVFLFFVCLTVFCGISKAQTANASQTLRKDAAELSLSLKRIACFDGGCPVYDLKIQSDGKIIFEGIQNTKTQGKTESNLSREKMNQLIEEINHADFFALRDSYTRQSGSCPLIASDNPSVIISVKLNRREKTVTHYLGCRENYKSEKSSSIFQVWRVFPQPLYNLENKINEIVETKRWIGEGR